MYPRLIDTRLLFTVSLLTLHRPEHTSAVMWLVRRGHGDWRALYDVTQIAFVNNVRGADGM